MPRQKSATGAVALLAPFTCLLVTSHALHIDVSHVAQKEWSTHSPGEVRCFCNLPQCVATGYMCKSAGRGCFSDLGDQQDVARAWHGCVELLLEGAHCHDSRRPLLICCHRDMCNHVDSPEARHRLNDSLAGVGINSSDGSRVLFNSGHQPSDNSELWFKVATIAVPICGGLILLLLIALAVRILRKEQDGFVHRTGMFPPAMGHKSPQHFERSAHVFSKKVPLLLQHHNDAGGLQKQTTASTSLRFDKNEANAKLNLVGKPSTQSHRVQPNDYTLLVPSQQNPSSIHKPNNTTSNLYRNVNLAFVVPIHQTSNSEGKLYDKQHLTSATSWGNPMGSAAHV